MFVYKGAHVPIVHCNHIIFSQKLDISNCLVYIYRCLNSINTIPTVLMMKLLHNQEREITIVCQIICLHIMTKKKSGIT